MSKAEELRKNLEIHKQNFFKKEKEKFIAAKKRLEAKKLEKDRIKETISKRTVEADLRYEAHLHDIRDRARNQITKTHEIAFITMLETQTKKVVLDERLDECRERKLKIMENIKRKLGYFCLFLCKNPLFFSIKREKYQGKRCWAKKT